MLADRMPAQDLRVGATFTFERGSNVRAAIGDAARTIATMPANFIRFPNSDRRVFEIRKVRPQRSAATLELSLETLSDWGSLRVPGHIWRALSRLGVWVEPVLVSEWGRLVRGYADRMGGLVPADAIDRQLAWEEPVRSTSMGKEASQRLAAGGTSLRCVWTGVPLSSSQLDIDHCFPLGRVAMRRPLEPGPKPQAGEPAPKRGSHA
ncbi:hypothetical protein GKE62_15045 [Novosphingobium sp. Gsoil 351]|nr:hypothetical protein GKE62_15045 [Novosphingobium sp. Gsoil 351]